MATEATTPSSEEPLDLADLDLSRLRLSKKDLETLSSITPGLPKSFQEQLLAKLPPTQARKLSRTLSVQTGAGNSSSTPAIKVYKRSQSSGRSYLPEQPEQEAEAEKSKTTTTDAPKTTSASTAIYRRSLSRAPSQGPPTTTEAAATAGKHASSSSAAGKSRSSSVCRDDYGKSSLCNSNYTSDISEKYKYYSPYLSKSSNGSKELPERRYSAALGRPPSGYLSPPPTTTATQLVPPSVGVPVSVGVADGSSSLRRRTSQRRISRFLRPDFFDEPARDRERDSQSVLREIREKSCDRLEQRKHSLPNVEAEVEEHSKRHTRNKSMEQFADVAPEKRRSQSRELDKHELANKILQELQLLSAVRSQKEIDDEQQKQQQATVDRAEETSTIKKLKRIKSKEREQDNEGETNKPTMTTTTTTTLVRKVKKVVRKAADEGASGNTQSIEKETKLSRPKSYPMKDLALTLPETSPTSAAATSTGRSKLPSKLPTAAVAGTAGAAGDASLSDTQPPRESRLIRPKSYPATKLTMPKELRKVTRSGVAIASIAEAGAGAGTTSQSNSEEKSPGGTPSSATNKDTDSSAPESRPTSIKKMIKVSKKSKLVPPTPVTPNTTTPTTTTATTTAATTPADSSKETSPVIKSKEKSPEKKASKGLLYALGQKFEKLRDSAMSKEKKAATNSSSSANNNNTTHTTLVCTQTQDSAEEERSSPEKSNSTLLRKKKPAELDKSLQASVASVAEEKRVDKRSRFDSMLRSLRERSVPRSQPTASAATAGNSISPKRSASVEELHASASGSSASKPNGAVNKMLGGLLRRFDRESSEQRRVRSTRSTSNIERELAKEEPTSPIYQNVSKLSNEVNCNCEAACPDCQQQLGSAAAAATAQGATASSSLQSNKEKRKGLMLDLSGAMASHEGGAATTTGTTTTSGTNLSSYRGSKTNPALLNGNGLYSNLPPYPGAVKSASSNNSSSQQSMDNASNNNNNNYSNNTITQTSNSINTSNTNTTNTNNGNGSSQTSGYRTSSAHEINRNNLLTPSFENIANYSSDSRSFQDDCASTSTFMSPTEEPELYFDNWSICSEDNYMLHATPSPTVSRLSRASQLSSPTRCSESSDPNESVIDRIKRRSFYSRFNEQKPRRTSSIVGPSAVRDYYREQQAAVKARSSQKLHAPEADTRAHSPDITQQFFRPLKLSPVGTELKPPVYRSPLDYSSISAAGATSKPRKSLNDIRNTSPSFLSSKRYEPHDYSSSSVAMRYKSSSSSSPSNGTIGAGAAASSSSASNGYYNTYNPKRRSSYTLNGTLPSGSSSAGTSHLDGYATLGRRSIRPYDHRTMSLLEPPTTSGHGSSSTGSTSYHRREARTPMRDYTSSISR